MVGNFVGDAFGSFFAVSGLGSVQDQNFRHDFFLKFGFVRVFKNVR